MDHTAMLRATERLAGEHPSLSVSTAGKSILGREIPCLSFGEGEESVLYFGTHHGSEHITAELLLCFVREILGGREGYIGGVSLPFLLRQRRFFVVPMLNPDGAELSLHGVAHSHFLEQRLLAMNGGSRDFTHWQANARGVDLNHNYDAGFGEYKQQEMRMGLLSGAPSRYSGEYPQSEPETAAAVRLLSLLRPRLVLSLHTQGEEIYCATKEKRSARMERMGRTLAELIGYRFADPVGGAAYGGLTDLAVSCGIPAFTIECGRGENPLPEREAPDIYTVLRPLFYVAPVL